jgi:hypothetical protein
VLRHVDLDLGAAPAGDYEIELHVRLAGRSTLAARAGLRVLGSLD